MTHQVRDATAFIWGAVIGTPGGLIGLGGAEFRLPVLIGWCSCAVPARRIRFGRSDGFRPARSRDLQSLQD